MEGNAGYLDFDLRFTRSEGGFRAEILKAPGGSGQRSFQLPWGEHELENYLLKIGQRRSGMRKADSPENRAAREFGHKLFESVFQGELKSAFRKSIEAARAGGNGLRLRLYLDETPELADLPWEYLYQSQRREFLALSTETPIVRYFDLPETVKPLAVTPPLRVLVMLSNPSDVDCLDVEKEWQKLKDAVRFLEESKRLIVERLERATLSELQSRLRKGQYHVFHFVGHGSFDPSTQESVLALENEEGRKRLVSGPDLGIYLRDEPALRLVLLNACEGARASRSDPFSGAAQSLVLKGIPAVIAMQFEVSDEAAIAMASGFYAALADDYPVDAALTEARKAVFAAGCSVEWGTPVLYLRAADGRIFEVDKSAALPIPPIHVPIATGSSPPLPPPIPPVTPLVRPESPREVEFSGTTRTRPPRRWLWLLVGMVLMFVLFVSFGLWLSEKRKAQRRELAEASPSPIPSATEAPTPSSSVPSKFPDSKFANEPMNAAANVANRPLVTSTATPGNAPLNMAKQQSFDPPITPPKADETAELKAELEKLKTWQDEASERLNAYDQDARKAIAGIKGDPTPAGKMAGPNTSQQAAPVDGSPAGRRFQPTSGWWGLVSGPPLVVSRVEFQVNGRVSGVAVDINGQSGQIGGTWSYDASTSMFTINYDNGVWARLPLTVHGQGFLGTVTISGTQVEMYLEREETIGTNAQPPSKKY